MSTANILETKRLQLRDAQPTDLDVVHDTLASDWDVIRCTGTWVWPADREFTLSRCQPIAPHNGFGGVVTRGDDIVGMVSIFGEGELGYMFAQDHWGQGYATEIGLAVVAEAFARKQWSQLKACVFDDNPGSSVVLRKLGFSEGPECSSFCVSRGTTLPTRNFTLSAPWA